MLCQDVFYACCHARECILFRSCFFQQWQNAPVSLQRDIFTADLCPQQVTPSVIPKIPS